MYGGSGIFPFLCKASSKFPSYINSTSHSPTSSSGFITFTDNSSLIVTTVPLFTLFDGFIRHCQTDSFSVFFSSNTSILAPVSSFIPYNLAGKTFVLFNTRTESLSIKSTIS